MNDDIPVAGNHLVSLDDLMPPEQEPAEPAASTDVALLQGFDPVAYITLAFGDLKTEALAIIESVGMTVHDTDTPVGLALAERDSEVFRDLRLATENLHQRYKRPFLEFGRMLDTEKKEILNWLAPYEQHYKDAIKAAKERAAAAQTALIEAERQRVADIEERIAALHALPGQALNQSATNVETMLIAAQCTIIDDSYGEYRDKAQTAKDIAVDTLTVALEHKRKAEADQAELARLRAAAPPSPPPEPPAPARKASGRAPAVKLAALEPLLMLQRVYQYLLGLPGEDVERAHLLEQVAATLQAATPQP